MTTPLLLLTNDDGVAAPGLRALADAVRGLGEVIIAAPDTERSGCGHSMTFNSMLRAQQVEEGRWSVSGTPADCVYFALIHLCPRPPTLVLSGINSGYNLGTDVFYSGTVSGAAEAHLRGLDALSISVERGVDGRWARPTIRALVQAMLAPHGAPMLLNVNVPHVEGQEQGDHSRIDAATREQPVMVTKLGRRAYHDAVDQRVDPYGRPYYWIGGPPGELRGDPGDDTWAVSNGLVSVTPLRLDLSHPQPRAAHALVERAVGPRLRPSPHLSESSS